MGNDFFVRRGKCMLLERIPQKTYIGLIFHGKQGAEHPSFLIIKKSNMDINDLPLVAYQN